MNGINKVVYEAISVKEGKQGAHGMFYPYGIKIEGQWHNGILGSQEQVDGMKAKKGQEVELFFFHDEKYGNKVRFVTDKDRKESPKTTAKESTEDKAHIQTITDELVRRIEALEGNVDYLMQFAPELTAAKSITQEPDNVNRDDIPEGQTNFEAVETERNSRAIDKEEEERNLPF